LTKYIKEDDKDSKKKEESKTEVLSRTSALKDQPKEPTMSQVSPPQKITSGSENSFAPKEEKEKKLSPDPEVKKAIVPSPDPKKEIEKPKSLEKVEKVEEFRMSDMESKGSKSRDSKPKQHRVMGFMDNLESSFNEESEEDR